MNGTKLSTCAIWGKKQNQNHQGTSTYNSNSFYSDYKLEIVFQSIFKAFVDFPFNLNIRPFFTSAFPFDACVIS